MVHSGVGKTTFLSRLFPREPFPTVCFVFITNRSAGIYSDATSQACVMLEMPMMESPLEEPPGNGNKIMDTRKYFEKQLGKRHIKTRRGKKFLKY